jgi:uncharacterized alkaline shock family protein YloU
MSQSSSPTESAKSAGKSPTAATLAVADPVEPGPLDSDQGKTRIADTVVSKVAGLAARQVPGVHKLGSPTARALGTLREKIPGQKVSVTQGISVEVGERQAAIDLDIVIEYGYPIADVADSIRKSVISAIEDLIGLEVTEVNIAIDDVHLPDDEDDAEEARVQ